MGAAAAAGAAGGAGIARGVGGGAASAVASVQSASQQWDAAAAAGGGAAGETGGSAHAERFKEKLDGLGEGLSEKLGKLGAVVAGAGARILRRHEVAHSGLTVLEVRDDGPGVQA